MMTSRPFRGAISDIDLRLLRVFDAVVTNGGFAAAEVALNKSRSAISMDISDLEKRLGVVLCRRGTTGFSLTVQGEHIWHASRRLFMDLDKFTDSVNETTSQLSGYLSISMTDDLVQSASLPLNDAIKSFTLKHPKVFLRTRVLSNRAVVQSVVDFQADFGFAGKYRAVNSLSFTPVFKERSLLYCGRSHEIFCVPSEELTIESVEKYAFASVSVAEEQEPAGILGRLNYLAEANNMSVRALLIRNGNFLGFLPTDFAESWVQAGEMRAILPDQLSIWNTIYRIERSGRLLSRIYKEFRECLAHALTRRRQEPAGIDVPT